MQVQPESLRRLTPQEHNQHISSTACPTALLLIFTLMARRKQYTSCQRKLLVAQTIAPLNVCASSRVWPGSASQDRVHSLHVFSPVIICYSGTNSVCLDSVTLNMGSRHDSWTDVYVIRSSETAAWRQKARLMTACWTPRDA